MMVIELIIFLFIFCYYCQEINSFNGFTSFNLIKRITFSQLKNAKLYGKKSHNILGGGIEIPLASFHSKDTALLEKVSDQNISTEDYLRKIFSSLENSDNLVYFDQLCRWDEITQLLENEILSRKDIKKMYLNYASSMEKGINFDQFCRLNQDIDMVLEPISAASDATERDEIPSRPPETFNQLELPDVKPELPKSNFEKLFAGPKLLDRPGHLQEQGEEDDDDKYVDEYIDEDTPFITQPPKPLKTPPLLHYPDDNDGVEDKLNVWSVSVDIEELYDAKTLSKLLKIYQIKAGDPDEDLLTYSKFYDWKEIRQIVTKLRLSESALRKMWLEAVEFERLTYGYDELANGTSSIKVQQTYTNTTSTTTVRKEKDFSVLKMKKRKTNWKTITNYASSIYHFKKHLSYQKNVRTILSINYNTFLRLYHKCKNFKDELTEIFQVYQNNPMYRPYLEYFENITKNHTVYRNPMFNHDFDSVMTYEEFFRWDYLKFLLSYLPSPDEKRGFLEYLDDHWKKLPLSERVLAVPYDAPEENEHKDGSVSEGNEEDEGDPEYYYDDEEGSESTKEEEFNPETQENMDKSSNNTEEAMIESLYGQFSRPLIRFKTIKGIEKIKFLYLCEKMEEFLHSRFEFEPPPPDDKSADEELQKLYEYSYTRSGQ